MWHYDIFILNGKLTFIHCQVNVINKCQMGCSWWRINGWRDYSCSYGRLATCPLSLRLTSCVSLTWMWSQELPSIVACRCRVRRGLRRPTANHMMPLVVNAYFERSIVITWPTGRSAGSFRSASTHNHRGFGIASCHRISIHITCPLWRRPVTDGFPSQRASTAGCWRFRCC